MTTIFIVAALAFLGYALVVHLNETDAGQPFVKRLWAAVLLAGTSIGALVMLWFGN